MVKRGGGNLRNNLRSLAVKWKSKYYFDSPMIKNNKIMPRKGEKKRSKSVDTKAGVYTIKKNVF